VSASSYVAGICPATSHFLSTASAQEQQLESQLPSILSAAATSGDTAAMAQAKHLLLSFVNQSSAAAQTWQNAIRAAGTPNVTGGSSVAAAFDGDAGKFVAALRTLRSDINALPTTDPTAFQQGIQAALDKFQSSSRSADSALNNLHNSQIDAAAKQTAACRALGSS